ncbi:MAG TPA: hypothetical protein VGE37_13760, partial [Archangium sp.]
TAAFRECPRDKAVPVAERVDREKPEVRQPTHEEPVFARGRSFQPLDAILVELERARRTEAPRC